MKRPLLVLLLVGLLTACAAPGSDPGAAVNDTPLPTGVGSALGASGPDASLTEGVVLGQTSDERGQTHALQLHVAPGLQEELQHSQQLFAVVSGSSTFSVTGEAAVDAWRFTVDSTVTGEAAPLIVIKRARGSVLDLAANPSRFAYAAELNEDARGASARLSGLIATVLATADTANPDGALYQPLAQLLQNPDWNGVLIFNAAISALPGEVQGQSTAVLAGAPLVAHSIGFELPQMGSTEVFFGTVDHLRASGEVSLQARFANSALVFFALGRG